MAKVQNKTGTPFRQGLVAEWQQSSTIIPHLNIPLKPMQSAIVSCNRLHNVLVNLPTGYGKSMLYQYPALLSIKTTIVIVPLRSLLWDSVIEARKLNLSACEFSVSNLGTILGDTPPKLLFVTPEKLFRNVEVNNALGVLVNQGKVELFVIDQAHCVCQWGNDFRPAYGMLSQLREEYPNVRVLAMTATAPPGIRDQLLQKLYLNQCYFFFASYNRPNLVYEVMRTTKAQLQTTITQLIQTQFQGQCGIIYCQTIKLCEQLHKKLNQTMDVSVFHSKVSELEREALLHDFKRSGTKILIATICFGMGINKPDVRFVIHAGVSFSIQNYYQESGRAGRDGRIAKCILLSYNGQENALQSLLSKDKTPESKPLLSHNKNILKLMMGYARNRRECRKSFMFKVLGQQFSGCNRTCDVCVGGRKFQRVDFTEGGTRILECLKLLKIPVTEIKLKEILKGQNKSKYKEFSSILGLMSGAKEGEVIEVIDELLSNRYLRQSSKRTRYGVIRYLHNNGRRKYTKIMLDKEIIEQVEVRSNPNTGAQQQSVIDVDEIREGNILMNYEQVMEEEILRQQDMEALREQDMEILREQDMETLEGKGTQTQEDLSVDNEQSLDISVEEPSLQSSSLLTQHNIVDQMVKKYMHNNLKREPKSLSPHSKPQKRPHPK